MSESAASNETTTYLLREILAAQTKTHVFNPGNAGAIAVAGAVSFVMALALNNAMQKTFAKIRVGSGLLGAWIYATIMLFIGLFLLFLIYFYLQPFVTNKFAKFKKFSDT